MVLRGTTIVFARNMTGDFALWKKVKEGYISVFVLTAP